MSANFKMNTSQSEKDLNIDLIGDFDGSSACELINTITAKDMGTGSIILNTNRLGNVISFGRILFDNLIGTNGIRRQRILIKGKKCDLMKIDGCGQIVCSKTGKPCQCNGSCPCSTKMSQL